MWSGCLFFYLKMKMGRELIVFFLMFLLYDFNYLLVDDNVVLNFGFIWFDLFFICYLMFGWSEVVELIGCLC